jgi:hypothetical protein
MTSAKAKANRTNAPASTGSKTAHGKNSGHAIEQCFNAPSDKKQQSEPLVSTGLCHSYGTKKFRRRWLKVISQFADLLSKSCVREASRNQIFVVL